MPETQTRREEENEKIAEIARKCQENGATISDLLFMCGWLSAAVKGYHRREDALRALPRVGGDMLDAQDVLRIIDDWDAEKP